MSFFAREGRRHSYENFMQWRVEGMQIFNSIFIVLKKVLKIYIAEWNSR